MPAVILADVWKNTPFMRLTFLLAGLQVISAELYEAARVDGAGPSFSVLDKSPFPCCAGSIVVALLFRTITAFQTFDLGLHLDGGRSRYRYATLSLHAYRTLFSFVNFGEGSALAVILALICFVMAALYARQLNIEES